MAVRQKPCRTGLGDANVTKLTKVTAPRSKTNFTHPPTSRTEPSQAGPSQPNQADVRQDLSRAK